MQDEFVKCPRDPRMEYLRDICENVFRKDTFRTWCQKCQKFEPIDSQTKSN